MSDKLPLVFDQLLDHLKGEGGHIVITFREDHHGSEWVVGYEFGREAPDSDMAGGAAYGMGPDLDSAVTQVTDQVGLG
jgi:hypothetical protein